MKIHLPKSFSFKLKRRDLISIALCTCLLSAGSYFVRKTLFEERRERLITLHAKKVALVEKIKKEALVLQELKKASSRYIEERIESLPLLSEEKDRIGALANLSPDHAPFQERWKELSGSTLSFTRSGQKQVGNLKETTLKLAKPVEMNRDDLLRLLSALEEKKGAPQLNVTRFELKRKSPSVGEETYQIQLEIVQREICP